MAVVLPLAAADIPRKAPDITINLDNGQRTQLSAYKGKVVAVIFILTGCTHCQAASKSLEKVYQAEKKRGFEVVAIAIDQGAKDRLAAFRKEHQVSFPLAYDAPISVFNFMQLPIMVGPKMPQLAFVDRDGMIRSQYPGESPFFGQIPAGNGPNQEKIMAAERDKNVRAEVEKLLGPVKRHPAHKARTAATKKQ